MKKILFSVLAIALVMTSCKEEKNPPLMLADINTYVTLTGQVLYESNIQLIENQTTPGIYDGYQVIDTIPVQAGLRVEARVDYGMYKDGTALNRFVSFSGVTDSLGMFSIQVPVPATMNTFAIADLSMQTFYLDNYPVAQMINVPFTYGTYVFYRTSYEIVRKRAYFDGQLPTLFAALPMNITASSDTTYVRDYFLGAELIINPGMSTFVGGTPFVVLP